MKLTRRRLMHLATGIALLPALPRLALALDYPTRPVRIVVGFAPGGGTDLTARFVAEWLGERLKQQFVVENRTGAGSNIAIEAVAKAVPDGYALLGFDPSVAINATLYENLNYNFIRDVAPVALLIRSPLVMEVNPSVPVATVPEFIAYAKANSGKINFGSGGVGTTAHVAGELFKMMTGVNLIHIPFRGIGPARTALLGGQVQVVFDGMAAAIGYVKAGQVRALAITSATRSEALPELATVGDFVAGFAADTWYGIGAPKKTPAEIIDKLNREINAALVDPKASSRLADLGGTVVAESPGDFGKLIADETEKWAKVVQFSGAKAG